MGAAGARHGVAWDCRVAGALPGGVLVGEIHFAQVARGIDDPINLHPVKNDTVEDQPAGDDQHARFRGNIWPSRRGLRKHR